MGLMNFDEPKQRLNLFWSIRGFGIESLADLALWQQQQ
jgi:hypothetical protein